MSDSDETDILAQQPGESRLEWKERTFGLRYGQNLAMTPENKCRNCGAYLNAEALRCDACGQRT